MKRISIILLAAAALCSCQKNAIIPQEGNTDENIVFTATMENVPMSKATLAGMTPSWEEGDEINIDGKTYVAQSSGTTTTFKAKNEPTERYMYHDAFFAAFWDGNSRADGNHPKILIPSEINETWAEGKFNMPMGAHCTGTDLEFKNICGVLKIIVKRDQIPAVKRIRVDSWPQPAGYHIYYEDNYELTIDQVLGPITVTYSEAVPTSVEGTVFYVAIPPKQRSDIKIELDPDGNGFTKSMTTKKDMKIIIERNKIYPIEFEDNSPAPTRGTAKATIGGVEVDVPWVQLWENGPKWAEYNVGVTDGKAESCGGLYCWGSTIDKDREHKHNSGTEPLSGNDDTAKAMWGGNWRMPTKEELELLNGDKVDNEWENHGDIRVRIVTGRDNYKNNSIFLPAAGFYADDADAVIAKNEDCYYWSSTPYGSDGSEAWCLTFFHAGQTRFWSKSRSYGFSVRAVLKETN